MVVVPLVITALALQGAPQGARKADPEQVSFRLRWVRQEMPGAGSSPPVQPVLLASPNLTTLDGQTASLELTTAPPVTTITTTSDTKPANTDKTTTVVKTLPKDTFFVSLSPTVEPADNKKQPINTATAANNTPTVRIFWNLRVAGNLPGGVESLSLTGASRLATGTGGDSVVARFSLADPKTGVVTEYRLEGTVVLGKDVQPEPTSVTPKGTAPYK